MFRKASRSPASLVPPGGRMAGRELRRDFSLEKINAVFFKHIWPAFYRLNIDSLFLLPQPPLMAMRTDRLINIHAPDQDLLVIFDSP